MIIVGVDDVARGTLAGPMAFCAFTHPEPRKLTDMGARDSKATSEKHREEFYNRVCDEGNSRWVVALVDVHFINFRGYSRAEEHGILKAVDTLANLEDIKEPIHALVDGTSTALAESYENLTYKLVAQGDQTEPLIAAASMLAKRSHDKYMNGYMTKHYPEWGFDSHKGYASPAHTKLLYELGPTDMHRVRACLTAVRNYAKKKDLPLPSWYKDTLK